MLFAGIDLAERHSAVVCLNEAGEPTYEATLDTGPKETPPNPFGKTRLLADWWLNLWENSSGLEETIFVIEDVAPHMMDSKPVLKLQGALIAFMTLHGLEAHIITAKTWQHQFGYMSKKQNGDSKKWATALCDELGYVPGCTLPEGTKILAKPKTDLRDGYLLASWLRNQCLGLDLHRG